MGDKCARRQAWTSHGVMGDGNQHLLHTAPPKQLVIDLQQDFDERAEDPAAARATNRELMARLNAPNPTR